MINIFKEIQWALDNVFGINDDVFTIRKNNSKEDIETSNGVASKDEKTNTCELCVALNNTVFKNCNKPEYYHPRCKCKVEKYSLIDVKLKFPIEKIEKYLFVDKNKKAMMETMGYNIKDSEQIYNLLKEIIRNKFLEGKYNLGLLNEHGQHFKINFILSGKRNHKDNNYMCHIGCVAFPYGKIKVATPLIKDKVL